MRRVVALPLLALLFWAPAARADQSDVLFDTGSVAQVAITLPDASRTALNADPGTYQPATLNVTANGVDYGPFSVTLKLKGSASFRDLDHKAGFKIKLAKGQPLLGLKKLTLNNMVQDPSMLHETLAYQTFRAAGVPASRTGYAFVNVNGAAYGVYLNVETIDDVALKRLFTTTTNHLYEGGYATDVRAGDVSKYEVDEGSTTDLTDLNALVGVAGGSGDFSDRVAGRADLAEMVRMWAVEKYTGQWDGYAGKDGDLLPNNYFLRSDTAGLFSMLPWGTDQTWVHAIGFDEGGLLFRRCRQDPSCEAMYETALADVRQTVSGLNLPAEADRLATLLKPWQAQDTRKENTSGEIGGWVRGVKNYLDARPGQVSSWLAAPTPPLSDPPEESPEESPAAAAATATQPDGPVVPATSGAATPVLVLRLRTGHVSRAGSVLSTRVRLPRSGSISQRMTMTVSGRPVTACSVPARRLGSGLRTLHCRLSGAARRRLRAGRLRLATRTRLTGVPLVRGTVALSRCRGC